MCQVSDYQHSPLLAELYDFVPYYSDRRDLEFYIDICRQAKGKILELGCGTGRVLISLAAAGLEIVGLDLSPHMLAKCRENLASQAKEIRDRVQLIQGRMTGFELDEEFAAIIIPFRPFQHLVSVSDQLACLHCVRNHLQTDGMLAFDLFQVDLSKMSDAHRMKETEDVAEIDLPDGRKMRRCSRFVATHRAEQYNDLEIIYYLTNAAGKTERLVQAFPFRYFFRYEVEHLLARAGFEVSDIYGNFDKSSLADDSPEMIFVARKASDNNQVEATR